MNWESLLSLKRSVEFDRPSLRQKLWRESGRSHIDGLFDWECFFWWAFLFQNLVESFQAGFLDSNAKSPRQVSWARVRY